MAFMYTYKMMNSKVHLHPICYILFDSGQYQVVNSDEQLVRKCGCGDFTSDVVDTQYGFMIVP